MDEFILKRIAAWQEAPLEASLAQELQHLVDTSCEQMLTDAFYKNLEFGTAGLRGVLGVGTNRMNIYTVAQATAGLADYLLSKTEHPRVALARDSRNRGEEFQQVVASVLAAKGIEIYMYPRIEPVPLLSFAVRHFKADAGIVLTASHNPAKYNGYKVYDEAGCQIGVQSAEEISKFIQAHDYFNGIGYMDFEKALQKKLVHWISDDVIEAYLDAVQKQSIPHFEADPSFSVVYTPLNGSGMECVEKLLKRLGVQNVHVVEEQRQPNGNFPTCAYPNPEFKETLKLGLELCNKVHPDLLLATDPDADRMGIAIPHEGEYKLLTGNEVGVLLIDWLCQMKQAQGVDIKRLVVVSTIVSTDLACALARKWGFELRRTLTGFKYIGKQIDALCAAGEQDRYLLGFEESYGYLIGDHVRDKDAIVATMLTIEMAAWYAERGLDLYEAMEKLYLELGYTLSGIANVEFEGAEGAYKMSEFMAKLRSQAPREFAGLVVEQVKDYSQKTPVERIGGLQKEAETYLPLSNIIEFRLEGNCKVIFRPSGTEPKLKAYITAHAAMREDAEAIREKLIQSSYALIDTL